MQEEFHCLGDAFGPGGRHIYAVTPVMFGCWANAPSLDPMRGKGLSIFGSFVHEHTRARGGYGRVVEIKATIEESFSGEAWVDSCGAQEVQFQGGLEEQSVPDM